MERRAAFAFTPTDSSSSETLGRTRGSPVASRRSTLTTNRWPVSEMRRSELAPSALALTCQRWKPRHRRGTASNPRSRRGTTSTVEPRLSGRTGTLSRGAVSTTASGSGYRHGRGTNCRLRCRCPPVQLLHRSHFPQTQVARHLPLVAHLPFVYFVQLHPALLLPLALLLSRRRTRPRPVEPLLQRAQPLLPGCFGLRLPERARHLAHLPVVSNFV